MITISAQVSLYPLGQMNLSPAIEQVLQIFRVHPLEVNQGPMSTLISGDSETIFAVLQEAFQHIAMQGPAVMVVTLSNACPLPEAEIKSQENS
jgi:uncharacterized protein YqgV (UPF0045/DUF77 family)